MSQPELWPEMTRAPVRHTVRGRVVYDRPLHRIALGDLVRMAKKVPEPENTTSVLLYFADLIQLNLVLLQKAYAAGFISYYATGIYQLILQLMENNMVVLLEYARKGITYIVTWLNEVAK